MLLKNNIFIVIFGRFFQVRVRDFNFSFTREINFYCLQKPVFGNVIY